MSAPRASSPTTSRSGSYATFRRFEAARRRCHKDGVDALKSHRRIAKLEEHFEYVDATLDVNSWE